MTPEAFETLYARAFPNQRPWSAQEFSALQNDPHSIIFSAEYAFAIGRVVAGEAELLTLVTDPDHRRRGLGRQCLTDFENKAIANGATHAFLEVADDNTAARSLYCVLGYQEVGRRAAYYKLADRPAVDAIVLKKALLAP